MIQDYTKAIDVNTEEPDDIFQPLKEPAYENEFVDAKTWLQKASTETGHNMYDHLTDVLNKMLAERPENVIDFFEEYSRKVKERRFIPLTDHFEDIYVSPGRYALAKHVIPLLNPIEQKRSTVDPADLNLADMAKNDMLQLLYYFEHAGIGLPKIEMFFIIISMYKLIVTYPIATIRFWGKIFGSLRNYFIIETELKLEEYEKRNMEYQKQIEEEETNEKDVKAAANAAGDEIKQALDTIARDQEIGGEGDFNRLQITFPPMPKNDFELPKLPPIELAGVGVNKKVYFVCNEIGAAWFELPDVTPIQIRVARQMTKAFTGNLDREICGYPEFEGTERNLLRAQIARISAGTHISPLGYYTFDEPMGEEEEEEAEEEEEEKNKGPKTNYKENAKYDPPRFKDLTDPAMLFWVHHGQYILPQGRTTWWNPNPPPEKMDEEMGEEEEEEPKAPGVEPEVGPALLTPCSEDVSTDVKNVWSVRTSSSIISEYAIAVVRSNVWPGAYCFSTQGKTFQNVYFGYGNKYVPENFSPLPLPPVEQDYRTGPEIMEITDPTGAVEEEWRIAHLPKVVPKTDVKGEEEAAEEEEDEDD